MYKKGLLVLTVILLSAVAVSAVWDPDTNGDGCIDTADLNSVTAHIGATGTSDYDVNNDRIVNENDAEIIQTYIDRGDRLNGCDGFKCMPEVCNGEDDDCDGLPDEDTDSQMCGGNLSCRSGQCVLIAGSCYDTDGYDIYTQGRSIGTTTDGLSINQQESCYERDIYGKLVGKTDCYGDACYLIEYSCSSVGDLVAQNIQCKYGCRYGKCRNFTRRCIETDSGLDLFSKSSGSFEDQSGKVTPLTDACIDKNSDGTMDTLVEYECLEQFNTTTNLLDESYKRFEITCTCSDGVCTDVANGECIDTDGNDKYTRGYASGKDAQGRAVSGFDYCIKRSGQQYSPAASCEGSSCYLSEFGCSASAEIVKYVHDCPLGCNDGLCAGTECSKGEMLTIDRSSVMSYDGRCEISQATVSDQDDLPGAEFNVSADYACCSGSSEAYCVYNRTCYPSSRNTNYYDLDGKLVACGCKDSKCSLSDGNHAGLWYDLDSSKDLCEGGPGSCNMNWYPPTGFRWLKPGISRPQAENSWEYESSDAECCGDDRSEFVTCQESDCICCDSADAQYVDGRCAEGTAQDTAGTGEGNATAETKAQKETGQEQEPATGQPDQEASSDQQDQQSSGPDLRYVIAIMIAIIIIIAVITFIVKRRSAFIMEEEAESKDKD